MLLFLAQCSFPFLVIMIRDRGREGEGEKEFYFVSEILSDLSGNLQVIIPGSLTHQVPWVLVAGEGVT